MGTNKSTQHQNESLIVRIFEDPVETATTVVEFGALALVFVIGLQVLLSKFFPSFYLFSTNEQKIAALFWGFFVLGTAVLLRLARLRTKVSDLRIQSESDIEVLGTPEIDIPRVLRESSRVRILTLSGSSIARLSDANVRDALESSKAEITILIANPHSQAIHIRYEKDEPDTHISGKIGIFRAIKSLSEFRKKLKPERQIQIDIRVYDNYPSVSLVQADKTLFSTVYGYRLRGADCPRIKVRQNSEYGEFLLRHFQTVYDSAMPLDIWILRFGHVTPE